MLEEACCALPNGGNHESRRLIAEQLLEAAASGHTTLNELRSAALRALAKAVLIKRQ
ncbi:hypothetical protein [Bradyrhizobium sp. Arg816]|uniref:hypothetical protein n=1 Tax=Bradyrhizobium sp. Arg816 TaxID=2998491 RepID=UPI0027B96094|nr:hypothetical protein [Bradyrhizobium sp. Arg816]